MGGVFFSIYFYRNNDMTIMNIFTKLFNKPTRKTLDQLEDLAMQSVGSEKLYGGYREPKAPIHEYERPQTSALRATNLFGEEQTQHIKSK